MKFPLFAAVAALLAASSLHAAESSRVWTNDKGKTVQGILKEKTATHASILLDSGKRVEIPIATLVQADQDYIAKAEVFPEPVIEITPLKVETKSGDKNWYQALDVSVKKASGRKLTVAALWITTKEKGEPSIYVAEEQKLEGDIPARFYVQWGWAPKESRGYSVGILDAEGKLVACTSSKPEMKKFWEGDWRKSFEKTKYRTKPPAS